MLNKNYNTIYISNDIVLQEGQLWEYKIFILLRPTLADYKKLYQLWNTKKTMTEDKNQEKNPTPCNHQVTAYFPGRTGSLASTISAIGCDCEKWSSSWLSPDLHLLCNLFSSSSSAVSSYILVVNDSTSLSCLKYKATR